MRLFQVFLCTELIHFCTGSKIVSYEKSKLQREKKFLSLDQYIDKSKLLKLVLIHCQIRFNSSEKSPLFLFWARVEQLVQLGKEDRSP